ncbi:major pollen allergen Ole e 10-like [Malania oleifera]|uniref:major pollen allergen Ole e 10-like n=1 Tax=Malania oleifera TaxID=397392 RepID=UPI0025AE54E6|nr:major pollen allergen Ole e 10-like [Malania oleifera]
MAKVNYLSIGIVSFLLCIGACLAFEGYTTGFEKKRAITWCVASPSATTEMLRQAIVTCCEDTGISCGPIYPPNGKCFQPNTLANHASVALNIFYKARRLCLRQAGVVTTKDPSYGQCIFEGTP